MSIEVYMVHSDKKLAKLCEQTLRLGGFSIKTFSSGEDALRQIEAHRPAEFRFVQGISRIVPAG